MSEKQSALKMSGGGAPSGWQCLKAVPIPFTIDPEKGTGEVSVARKPDEVLEGIPVHVYADTSPQASPLTKGYIGIQTGLPLRIVSANTDTGRPDTIDFYDYGARITIPPPPC